MSTTEAGAPGPWPRDYGRRVLAEVDSTNAEAARIAATLAGPEWILAERQTRGRGRRGRDWRDPPGNFAATLVLCSDDAPDRLALRSFVASLALYDAFVAICGRSEGFALKWPNDVLLNGGKLAGILLETLCPGRLAVGIGVNLREAPRAEQLEPQAFPPVSLASSSGAIVSPAEFLAILAPAYAARESQFATLGFAPIRDAWLARAARLGDSITARTGATELRGLFETVDEAGRLVLSTPRGRQAISAAEVFF